MSTIPKAAIEAALNAETDELPEGVQYVLLRGLHAMGWEQPTSGSWEVLEAAILAALPHLGAPVAAAGTNDDQIGWLYFNPDAGTEFSPDHPVESGEVPDADRVRAATVENLLSELQESWELLGQTRRQLRELPPATSANPLMEQMAEALKSFKGAYEAYVNVMRNTTTGGETLAERRFSTGERQEEAEESAHEALCGITFAQLSAVSDALAAYEAEKAGKEESK